jgi:PAS domain S-box-containing protein
METNVNATGLNDPRPDAVSAWLAAVINSSDDAIVSKTLDGVILSWNPGAERIFGYTAAEAIGQSIFLIIPDDRKAEEEDVLARLRRAGSESTTSRPCADARTAVGFPFR